MFKNPLSNIRNISYKMGQASGKGYSFIRNIEKKAKEIDVSLGGVPGDIFRMSPLNVAYQTQVVPIKQGLKLGEKLFKGIGENKKLQVAESAIELYPIITGGSNDFIGRSIQSDTFNKLYRSPYIQNKLM